MEHALNLSDTICALATPPGVSERAVIRVAGQGTRAALKAMECCPLPTARTATRVVITIPSASARSRVEVPLLATLFTAPASYTGEDAAEFSFPGSHSLVERILGTLTATPGVRLAQPGEFTARAFLSGRMSLEQAEGVAALISAHTADQLTAAQSLMRGSTGEQYRRWAHECTTLLALVEAGIDFTDQEDVVAITPHDLAMRSAGLAQALQAHLGSSHGAESSHILPTVALAGRPNAGKSTLFNALLHRPRALASPVAGTTRDVLEEPLDLSMDSPGLSRVMLQDLAGLSTSRDGASDAAAQEQAREAISRADVILWCDPTGRFERHDSPVPSAIRVPIIRVRTFGDLPAPDATPSIRVCALDGWNIGALRRAIADQACAAGAPRSAGLAALLPRHRHALTAAARSLHTAAAAAQTPELAAAGLRAALNELSQLVGTISPDDIIGRVFSLFCVGK